MATQNQTLVLIRTDLLDTCTIGELYHNDKFICYTLEDKVRPIKIYGETAIPYGTYKVIVNHSQRFNQLMPLLLNVPNFEGIRVHMGNYADSETFLKNEQIRKEVLTDSKIRIKVI